MYENTKKQTPSGKWAKMLLRVKGYTGSMHSTSKIPTAIDQKYTKASDRETKGNRKNSKENEKTERRNIATMDQKKNKYGRWRTRYALRNNQHRTGSN